VDLAVEVFRMLAGVTVRCPAKFRLDADTHGTWRRLLLSRCIKLRNRWCPPDICGYSSKDERG
jgi:hypothetical protein